MKKRCAPRISRIYGSCLFAILLAPDLLAQGALDPPPGGPQPTQKSLQELWNKMNLLDSQLDGIDDRVADVTSRLDLFSAPASSVSRDDPDFYYVIQQPGSYFISGNAIAGGFVIPGPAKPNLIKITADNVVLDLNGFELRAGSTSLPGSIAADTAVLVEGDNVTVRNGSIRGFATSLRALGKSGGTFEGLRIDEFSGTGLYAGDDATVAECRLSSAPFAGRDGIIAGEGSLVRDCVVRLSQASLAVRASGIFAREGALVRGCRVSITYPAPGARCYQLTDGGVIEACSARLFVPAGRDSFGFVVENGGSVVRACSFTSEGGGDITGYEVFSGAVAEGCVAHLSSDAGTATGFTTRDEDGVFRNCFVRGDFGPDSVGFRVTGGASSLSDCRVTDCTVGFQAGGSDLLRCTAERCGDGFELDGAATLRACVARDGSPQGGDGFRIAAGADGAVLRDCVATDMTSGNGFGFNVGGNRARLIGCQADRNRSNFVVTGNNNRLDGCVAIATATAGGVGFLSSGANNTVIRCEAKNCSVNFSLNASTRAGSFVISPNVATNPYSNISN